MLDQNTDRMWYVIGAVLIGAAIILGMNTLLPNAFASVSHNFTSLLDEIHFQSVGPEHIIPFRSRILDYDEETETFLIEIDPETAHSRVDSGVQIKKGSLLVPYNHRHTINYQIRISFDAESVQDVNTVVTEGEPWAKLGTVDNDEWESRRYNGKKAQPHIDYDPEGLAPVMSQSVKGGVWHSMTYTYTNTDEGNVNEIDIMDRNRPVKAKIIDKNFLKNK